MKENKKIFSSSLEGVFKQSGLPNWLHNSTAGSFIAGEEYSPLSLGQRLARGKVGLLQIILLVVFLVFISRLMYLQIYQGEHFRTVAEGNRIKEEYLLPRRGIIFDRFANQLVRNNGSFNLIINKLPRSITPQQINDDYNILLPWLNKYKSPAIDPNIWQLVIKRAAAEPQVLVEEVPYDDAIAMKIILSEKSVASISAEARRQYPSSGAWSHVLGYLSRIKPEDKEEYVKKHYQVTERVGRDGLESIYEEQLHGQVGVRQLEVDSLGRVIDELTLQPEQPGNNLFLTIDAGLTEATVESLKKRVPKARGAVVALDPRNGQVLTLVSWPTYDNNVFHHNLTQTEVKELFQNPERPMFNRAISGQYPSGSTIKMVYAAAGLAEKVIDKSTTVLSTGGINYGGWFFGDWKAGGHGVTNVIKALAESVNTFFYILGAENYQGHIGLGLDRLRKYLTLFGLGQETGIDLPNEGSGFIPSAAWKQKVKKEPWYPGDTLHLAIGQGDLLVTPLQVANYMAVMANGGILFKPYLVGLIKNSKNEVVKEYKPEILKSNMVSDSVINIVREGLRACVTSGSCRSMGDLPYSSAGKTGTAQVDGKNMTHAWYTGFMPFENPRIVVMVLVENGGEGSSVAAPIAKDMLAWYAENRLKDE